MHGQLSEIDIRSLLHLIELGQRTGELLVETHERTSLAASGARRGWFVFFQRGQILYATSPEGGTSRLRDFLQRYGLEAELDALDLPAIATTAEPEYGYLWLMIEKGLLEPERGRNILQSMVHETLFDLLELHQGRFIFELGPPLTPQLSAITVSPALALVAKQLHEWKQFYPQVQSPDQCPLMVDRARLQEILPAPMFETLAEWSAGNVTIRQIARQRNRDLLTVARALHPYLQQGLIQLLEPPSEHPFGQALTGGVRAGAVDPSEAAPAKPPRIACLEDSPTVRKAIEQALLQMGYDVISLSNPLEALGVLFRVRPDVILCDIAMPELDGYEVCAMLRQANAFRETPILMLTGRDGFIDRVRARLVGATDYLTKPFKKHELKTLLEKYAGPVRSTTAAGSAEAL